MQQQNCKSCGAPLKIRPRDIKRGVIGCEYCGADIRLDKPGAAMDEDVKRGLKLIGKMKDLMGVTDDDLDGPAEKPYDSKIELENLPGHSFRAVIPPAGFGVATGFLGLFTLAWCGFMVVWNVIAFATGTYMMAAFGLLHDAVGVVLLLATFFAIFGKEELRTEGDTFIRDMSLFGFRSTKRFSVYHIEDVVFKISSRQSNRVKKGLYLVVGSKNVRIASNAKFPELKWLRQELLAFFKPNW